MEEFDVIIIGGGIAGLSAAYEISKSRKILLLEQEEQPGYHATGRSAAVHATAYLNDNTAIFALTKCSWPFFDTPPEGFTEYPLHHPRGGMMIAHQDKTDDLRHCYEEIKINTPEIQWVDKAFINEKFPPLKDDYTQAAIYIPHVYDIDVSAVQEGYLRAVRKAGGKVRTGFPARHIQKTNGLWVVGNGEENFKTPCLVNAAGAWADQIAEIATVKKIGLQPLRRTAILVDGPDGKVDPNWPMVIEFTEEFYFKPDAGKLLVSPANEDLSVPTDAQPEELDIAHAVHFAEQALELQIGKIDHSWAGLRSFVEDRGPVIGFDPQAEGFFWIAGQGGFGIQTAPAAGRLAASLILGKYVPQDIQTFGLTAPLTSPARLKNRQ